jgi:hypothetical protein
MMLQTAMEQDTTYEIPPQVTMILSAMEAGRRPLIEHRNKQRMRLRVQGSLRLFSEPSTAAPRMLYTRDVHSRAMGFISPSPLPLGYGGTLELPDPYGGFLSIPCTIIRCRQALEGWYEGSVSFSRVQPQFDAPVG